MQVIVIKSLSIQASTPKDGECSDVSIGSAYIAVIEVQVADLSKS